MEGCNNSVGANPHQTDTQARNRNQSRAKHGITV